MYRVFKAKWILPAGDRVVEDGFLVLENGRIIDVIENINVHKQNILNNSSEIVDYGNSIITPGFINLHTHLQFTDLKNDRKEQSFTEWIKSLMCQYFFLSKKKKINSVINGAKEALLSGTTCIAQLSGEPEFLEAFNKLDLKTCIFLETFANTPESSETEFNKLIQKYNQMMQNKNDNIFLGLSPHSVYTVHPLLWKKIAEFSSNKNVQVHTHLAESVAEIEWLKCGRSEISNLYKLIRWKALTPYKNGLNPVEYLKEFDILNENLIAAHMIQLDKDLMEEIFSYGIKLAHCPRSNMLLHGKTLSISDYKDHLSLIGIGTDSKYSNYDLSILHEAKFVKFSSDLDLFQLLNMLTINAAKILKIGNITGSLEKGKDADFIVFKLNKNQTYLDLFNLDKPDDVFIKGKQIVKGQNLVKF